MKALVYTALRQVEVQELQEPKMGPNEVIVRVRAAGVCGSDTNGFLGRSKKRVPPLVLGHEFCGEIEEAGKEVTDYQPGTPVAVYPLITCGDCKYCRTNRQQLCIKRKLFGLDMQGGFADYVAVPEQCLFRMSTETDFVGGALIEPLATALHIIENCGDVLEKTGLIYGAGSIGLLVCYAAKQAGVGRIAVVDRNTHRLGIAKSFGADLVIDSKRKDPVDSILEWTGGEGVDFSVDAVGETECRHNAMSCTSSGGTIVLVGLVEEFGEMDLRTTIAREWKLKGSYAYTRDNFAQALTHIERNLLPLDLIISEAEITEGQAVFDDLTSENCMRTKVIFRM